MKNIETKCITHAPTLLSHKGSAAWAIALNNSVVLGKNIKEICIYIYKDIK